jgi:hypothetical protein
MLLAAILFVVTAVSARAVDKIQVYNAEIAKVGQWTFQLHSNYAFNGRKERDFPGGLIPNRALNGTGEWAYGITGWWEMGFSERAGAQPSDLEGVPLNREVLALQLN